MKSLMVLGLITLAALSLGSCATINPISNPPYYPTAPDAPLLDHQGEVQMSGAVSPTGNFFNLDYAVTDHIGLLGTGAFAQRGTSGFLGNQYEGELGLGYFDTTGSGFVHEFYGAGGWGTASYSSEAVFTRDPQSGAPLISAEGDQVRFWHSWLQADVGYEQEHLSLTFLLRATYVNSYYDIATQVDHIIGAGVALGATTPSILDSTPRRTSVLYLTPGIEGRAGVEHFKLRGTVYLLAGIYGVSSSAPLLLTSLGLDVIF